MVFDPIRHFHQFNFQSCRRLLVAVSGGSDSVGLLCGLYHYFKTLPHHPRLAAVTVDHGLREGSAAEAVAVGALCAAMSIPHTIKRWQGTKPTRSIQALARQERRALLAMSAREVDADVVLIGHTLDDQIETIVMRERRGSCLGLAGIAPASLTYDDRGSGAAVWMMRPLLGVTRTAIRIYLQDQNVGWHDDPSNSNQAFERIAVRDQLRDLSDERRHAYVLTSRNAAEKRERLAFAASDLLKRYAQEIAPGLVHVDPEIFTVTDGEAACLFLRTLIAFAGGVPMLGDLKVAEELFVRGAAYDFSSGAKPWRQTSNRALIDMRQSGVYLLRESRKEQGNDRLFDGRYRKTGAASEFILKKLKPPTAPVPASLLRLSAQHEPRYSINSSLNVSAFDAPRMGYPIRRLVNPWPDLIPSFDLELAKKLNEMCAAVALPDNPVYLSNTNITFTQTEPWQRLSSHLS